VTKRPYLRAADRRRQLLDATGRIFDRASFGGITMAGVAAEAGVSRQLVYDHFTDLDGLYEAFVADRLARYRSALPRASTVDADTAVRASFRHLLHIPPADRRVVRLLAADVGNPALRRAREQFCADELRRWPGAPRSERAIGRARAAVWMTTSALLALADAVTDGDLSEADATTIAIDVVRAVRSA
jgi:AcrR family transcriptional regulator